MLISNIAIVILLTYWLQRTSLIQFDANLVQTTNKSKKWYGKTPVASYELLDTSSNSRVTSSTLRVASSNPRITSSI